MADRPLHPETIAVHAGRGIDPATGAVAEPIHLSTTFQRPADGDFRGGFDYTRSDNPNRRAFEQALAVLEGGAAAAAFASGLAACSAIFQALQPNDHVVAPLEAYHGVIRLLRELFARWQLRVDFVDMPDLDAVRKAVGSETKLIWAESPSNPTVRLTDLAALAEIAHGVGARLICDNTWSPLIQRPFELGADLVMHSTTKYFGGHSDVLGGALIVRQEDELFQRLRDIQKIGGAVPSPFDCWLVHRGMQTLPCRLRAHCENAQCVAEFLESHPGVARVHYPGLKSHPQHALATRQMNAFGGMLSFEIKGDRAAAMALPNRTRIFTRATSLGGVESLIEHRQSIEGPDTRTPETLLRLSIGLEHPDDLIADLDRALGA
ncbi:MAG TPA: aminotransferase class I/II-fold pyridoxal phosphate-dependent enzyme [Chthoniobacterales bacterium]|jgi:cystathionine gamma-synthase|nr:aminotransferase class I/II-fold pyridoxal phosphate-dependent enzyme [Chthoniobacterales bacterium]